MTSKFLARVYVLAALGAATVGCHASSHPTTASDLGTPRPAAQMLALLDAPGELTLESVASADWVVDRAGLINLDHDEARAHHLEAGPEPIQIYFHAIRHPKKGLFIVDTGVERNYRDSFDATPLSWLVKQAMDPSTLVVREPLRDYLERQPDQLRGVFLTHMHLDHVMGLPDVDDGVPVYVGPGETTESSWQYLLTRSSVDGHLEGKHALRELRFVEDDGAPLRAVSDVFGDGSLWAIWVPGHTRGSVAYLARTSSGPVLLTGDACHTRWGWQHGVEPGDFSSDGPRSVTSFAALQSLVKQHPNVQVRVGHQP